MKMFIPELGTKIKLIDFWHFPLHAERRNENFGELFDMTIYSGDKWSDLKSDQILDGFDETLRSIISKVHEWYHSLNLKTGFVGNIAYYFYDEDRQNHPTFKTFLDNLSKENLLIINNFISLYKDTSTNKTKYISVTNLQEVFPVSLHKDTILSVDRIYVRKGCKNFSSLTFNLISSPNLKKTGRIRFWVKIEDVNQLQFELI